MLLVNFLKHEDQSKICRSCTRWTWSFLNLRLLKTPYHFVFYVYILLLYSTLHFMVSHCKHVYVLVTVSKKKKKWETSSAQSSAASRHRTPIWPLASLMKTPPCWVAILSAWRRSVLPCCKLMNLFSMRLEFSIREAVFSPNPMQYRLIWSCDFRYNFHGR